MITPKSVKEYTYEDLSNLEELEEFNGMKHFRNTINGNEYCTQKAEWEAFLIGLLLRQPYIQKLEAIVDYVTDLAYKQNAVAIDELIKDGELNLNIPDEPETILAEPLDETALQALSATTTTKKNKSNKKRKKKK